MKKLTLTNTAMALIIPYPCIAMDEDETWFAYESVPEMYDGYWECSGNRVSLYEFNIIFNGTWEMSLTFNSMIKL